MPGKVSAEEAAFIEQSTKDERTPGQLEYVGTCWFECVYTCWNHHFSILLYVDDAMDSNSDPGFLKLPPFPGQQDKIRQDVFFRGA